MSANPGASGTDGWITTPTHHRMSWCPLQPLIAAVEQYANQPQEKP